MNDSIQNHSRYCAYLTFRNTIFKHDQMLYVINKPFLLTLDNDNIVFQIISDIVFSNKIHKGNEYEYYILITNKLDHCNSVIRRLSTYLYTKDSSINLLFKFRFKCDIMPKDNKLILYEQELSYSNIIDILIRFLPKEIIGIIYNMLNIKCISFTNFKINSNSTYICNPIFYINKKEIYSRINKKITLGSYHGNRNHLDIMIN